MCLSEKEMNHRMKRFISYLIVLMFLLAGCSSGSSESSSSDNSGSEKVGVIELTQGSWFPPAETVVDLVTSPWEESVKEKTNGEVVVKSIHGSQLGSAATLYQDVAGGVYEIGWASPILFDDTELFPFTIANLPFALTEPESGANIMKKFYEKYKDPKEVEYLGITASDPYVIWSKKPIKTVKDLKGMKIRAASAVQIDVVKNWGATPVDIQLTDMYEALQKGTLDAVVFATSGGVGYNIIEVAPYMTYLPVSSIALMPVMNKDAFSRLSNESKSLFNEGLGQEMADLYTKYTVDRVDDLLQVEIKEKGGEIIYLSDEEMKGFQIGIEEIWGNWVKEANEKGYPGDEMMEDFKTFIKEEGQSLPFE